jgi:exosortase
VGKLPAALSWQVLLAAGCVTAAYLPFLVAHFRQLWLRPHYQFFPVVLVGAAVLGGQRLRDLRHLTPGPRALAAGLAAAAAWLLAAAVVLDSSWLGTVSALVLLAAALVAGGRELFTAAWPAWAVLWLIVPPPFELDRDLTLALQTFTTRWSSRLLDLFGVFHIMDGHVVEISGRRLLVEEACAGINSLFSILACAVLFVLWARRPPLRGVLLVAAAVGWVLAANVARVVLIAVLFSARGLDLTGGWHHEAVGLGLFALALALVWSTDRLLAFLASTGGGPPAGARADRAAVSADAAPERRRAWPGQACLAVAGVFGVLVAANVYLNGFGTAADAPAHSQPVTDSLAGMTRETLTEKSGEWRLHGFAEETRNPGSAFGEFSKTWVYRRPMQQAVLSLDYPFPGWHDLTRCYTSQGWVVEDEAVVQEGPGLPSGWVALRLTKPGYRFGYLVFTQFDGTGRVLAPRLAGSQLSLHRHEQAWRRLEDRLTGTTADVSGDPSGSVYQLQVFVESFAPLQEQDLNQARELFVQSWERLHRYWATKAGK